MSKGKARARKTKKVAPTPTHPEERSRRDVLQWAAYGSLGVVAAGGLGIWAVGSIRATAAEQDMGRIGQGTPAIVQIHDPTCASCTALQREVRRTLACLGDAAPLYLVASIKTEDGSAFAYRHGLPHVTLAFVDGDGGLVTSLTGVRQQDELKPIFESFGTA